MIESFYGDKYEKLGSSFTYPSKIVLDMILKDYQDLKGLRILEEFSNVVKADNFCDGKDRVDLSLQAVRALSLVSLGDPSKVKVLSSLLLLGAGKERSSGSNSNKKEVILNTLEEVVQKKSAYRLAVMKMRTTEEHIIRDIILNQDLI